MKFITFEGCDASGKSTQANILYQHIKLLGFPVIITKEPGGTPLADKIRNIILSNEVEDSLTELLLLSAARRDHALSIKNKLKEGFYVISDRFIDSSIAYQCYAKGLDPSIAEQLIKLSTDGLTPDITILLDTDISTLKSRINSKHKNFYDDKNAEFFNKVRDGFISVAKNNPNRIKIVDASMEIKLVSQEVLNVCKEVNIF